jgi:pyroglutamyl-peptidase
VHCIITGFDPFDGADSNPSQLAVESLPHVLSESEPAVTLSRVVLTTCCDEAWTLLQKETAQLGANTRFFILLAGVAAAREAIYLERFALNVRQYRILDNRGHQWHDEYIEPKGPDALRTVAPLSEMVAKLREKGHLADISNYAGAFVCNETYYRAMYKWHPNPLCAGVLFAHLPSTEFYRQAMQLDNDEQVIQAYADALQEIVRGVKW